MIILAWVVFIVFGLRAIYEIIIDQSEVATRLGRLTANILPMVFSGSFIFGWF
jgi:hypothetical protein